MNKTDLYQRFLEGCNRGHDRKEPFVWRMEKLRSLVKVKQKQGNKETFTDIVSIFGIEPTPYFPKVKGGRNERKGRKDGTISDSETPDGCIHSFSSEQANSLRL